MANKHIPQLRFKDFNDKWEKIKVSEIGSKTFGGGTPKTSEELYWNGNLNWIQSSDLDEHNLFITDTNKKITKEGLNKSAAKLIPKDSIAIVTRVGVGKLSLVPFEFATSQDFLSISDLKIDKNFASYLLYKLVQREKENVQGTSIKGITKDDLLSKQVCISNNEAEQSAIGTLFQTFDELLSAYKDNLANYQAFKASMLSKMFPKAGQTTPEIRLDGFEGEWAEKKLGEVTERVQGNDGRMDLPTLTISAANGWMNQEDRFSQNIAGKEQKNYTLLKKGELSYNHGNSKLAKYGVVFELESYEEALVPRVYHSFRVKDGLSDEKFIETMFTTKRPDRELGKLISSGARMDGLLNINYDEFMGIKITIPNVEEQHAIGSFFSNLDTLISFQQERIEQLENLKKKLLKDMFI